MPNIISNIANHFNYISFYRNLRSSGIISSSALLLLLSLSTYPIVLSSSSAEASTLASTYTESNPLQLTLYDLATYGQSNCKGDYDYHVGSGDGYTYLCMHSGTVAAENTYSGTASPTVWYNYAAASAGTIKGTASNMTTTTYDICPAGWRLPTRAEIQSLGGTSYVDAFNPLYGGNYGSGTLYYATTHGFWWSSEAPTASSDGWADIVWCILAPSSPMIAGATMTGTTSAASAVPKVLNLSPS